MKRMNMLKRMTLMKWMQRKNENDENNGPENDEAAENVALMKLMSG